MNKNGPTIKPINTGITRDKILGCCYFLVFSNVAIFLSLAMLLFNFLAMLLFFLFFCNVDFLFFSNEYNIVRKPTGSKNLSTTWK